MVTDFIWQNADKVKPVDRTQVLIFDTDKNYVLGVFESDNYAWIDTTFGKPILAVWWTYISPAPG